MIPSDWDKRLLEDDITLLSGHHVLAKHCNTDAQGVPYLTGPADFPDGHIRQTKFTTRPATLCAAGDILVTVKGSGSGTLVEADASYCISRQLMAIRTKKWDAKFLFYSLLQNSPQIKAASTGLIPGLSRSDILNQSIPLPREVPEQRAIAEALSDVDGLIEGLGKLIIKRRAIKQAAMQQLLTGKTRLPGFAGEWTLRKLKDLGTFRKGQGIRRDQVSQEGLACIRYGELYTLYSDFIVEPVSRVSRSVALTAEPINQGDLLFAASGETAEEIGRCAAYVGKEEAYAGGDIVVLTPTGQSSRYLGYLMNHEVVALQKARLAQGDAVVHISSRNLAQVEIELPPVDEQEAIAAVLSDVDAGIAALERHLDKTKQIKQGMMQELLTGKTRLV